MTHLPKHLLQSLLVWLMLVAIPFQGFAAASMAACGPVARAHHAVERTVAMPAEHCAMMTASVHADDAGEASQASHSEPAAPDHHSKCSTCASCCAAAMAPPAPTVRAPGAAPDLAVFHVEDGQVASVHLALPERPPKTS